jgi:putative salt-induced outer membrane protein YdiY
MAAISLLGHPGSAVAQDEEEGPRGWYGNANFGFSLTAGNSETTNLGLSFDIYDELATALWSISATYILATTEGEETANKLDSRLRYDYTGLGRFFVYGLLYGGFNRQAGLDALVAPSAGVGYTLLETEATRFSLSAGGAVRNESFQNDSTNTEFSLVGGQNFSLTIDDDTNLTQSFAYVPNTSQFSDYLLRADLSFTTMFTDLLGWTLNLIYDYRNQPFVDATGEARKK